jgi:N-methylhydantoinase B/oxoprolinase/acetone carboxylase alpha subunit
MVTLNSERRHSTPYGLHGGEPGQVGRNRLVRDGVETDLGGKATVQVRPGDRLIVETPGGGGWRRKSPF